MGLLLSMESSSVKTKWCFTGWIISVYHCFHCLHVTSSFLFTPQKLALGNISCTCCVPLARSLPLSVPHSHLLSDGIVSDILKFHSSLAFRPSGMGNGDSGVFFLCQGKEHDMIITPSFSWSLTHHPVIFDWLPGHLMPESYFPSSLQLCHSPGMRKMVLVLERCRIFRGTKYPKDCLLL